MTPEQLEGLRPIIGTLAHNRVFEPREVDEYLKWGPMIGLTQSAVMRELGKLGYVQRCGRGVYSPTRAGWAWIEGALDGHK